MKRLASFASILLIQIPLLGCAGYISGIQDHNTFGAIWKGPSSSNGYVGELAAFSGTGYPQVEQRASQNCSSYGGLKGQPTKSRPDNPLAGTTYWKYQCNGMQSYSAPPASPVQKPPVTTLLSIEQAKSKCVDLGFKQGTEQFGNCVLKFTK
ncbi:hypothetical protein [Polynucleobacter bastaniensis]|uniref:hypothetical protein n=1 Tax=Polynucleobacter bastaniensis TaxID=2081039 RepID=UPI001C0AF01E|nr:hypothetical protein [Polynucleobacter bastaniensis]MBU3598568.1 hypothetical protein [Polynucleobacter bastaniensis]